MRAITDPSDVPSHELAPIVVHALTENKRPVGFAPWPKEKKRKKKKRAKSV
jgi:hypothetical protein